MIFSQSKARSVLEAYLDCLTIFFQRVQKIDVLAAGDDDSDDEEDDGR